jgi:glycosyltransferase involved in cell wall biosynthesis
MNASSPAGEVELSVVMPCLNEAETLAACIGAARGFLRDNAVAGEVVVADNGSSDSSREVAIAEGARVELVTRRGYGAALMGGIAAARGRYVIMGDADQSYDFSALMPFLDRLRKGDDLVMGNRFRGGIMPGAMPFLHRYLGNPVLSFIGRLFFHVPLGDFHCGVRGFNRASIQSLGLVTTGMEFASEMIVKSSLAGQAISEVPAVLRKDGRSRPPHLRTWRDGWRHLRFLMLYNPRWLFFYPGTMLFALGVLGMVALSSGPMMIDRVGFDINTFLISCFCFLLGLQFMCFAVIARQSAALRGLLPPSARTDRLMQLFTLERVLLLALFVGCAGLVGVFWCVAEWASVSFGTLRYASLLRILVPAMTAVAASVQLAFTAFLANVISIPVQNK